MPIVDGLANSEMEGRMPRCTGAAGLAVAAVLAAGAANATAISTNVWYDFSYINLGGPATSLLGGAGVLTNPDTAATGGPPWTFALARPGVLFMTDADESGDQFELRDFGTVIGKTSSPTPGAKCFLDLTCALDNPDFSKGSFALAAGDHSITGAVLQYDFASGRGGFIVRVDAIPLPATATMLLAALGGLGLWGRRRAA